MLLKLYSIISMMSIITNLKVSHDIFKNKELVERMKSSEIGIGTLYVYKSKLNLLIKSLTPLVHLSYAFMGSFLFITDFFNNERYIKKFLDENK